MLADQTYDDCSNWMKEKLLQVDQQSQRISKCDPIINKKAIMTWIYCQSQVLPPEYPTAAGWLEKAWNIEHHQPTLDGFLLGHDHLSNPNSGQVIILHRCD